MSSASFCEDLFIEILKRLPATSLLRFMLVQKSWHRLIQTSYFKAAYSHHHQNNNYIIFRGESGDSVSASVNDKQCNQYSYLPFPKDIIGEDSLEYYTSNGLVCIHNSKSQIYLWNPFIRKYKTLPDLPFFYDDPRLRHRLTFGYLPKINDYKIIKIGCIKGKKPESSKIVYVYVYSLSTNSWKKVSEDKFSGYRSLEKYNSVVVKGAAYWAGSSTGHLKVIICFDIENETIREIMLPLQYSNSDAEIITILVQKGSDLSLFCLDLEMINLNIWILEKEENKGCWTKKIALNLDNIKGNFRWWCEGFRNNDEIILIENFCNCNYITYDIEKKEPTEIFGDVSDSCSAHHVEQPVYQGILAENLDLLGENCVKSREPDEDICLRCFNCNFFGFIAKNLFRIQF